MLRYLPVLIGLALCANPAGAQDYIDLEQERSAPGAAGEVADPNTPGSIYGDMPADAQAPAGVTTSPTPTRAMAPRPPGPAATRSGGQNFGDFYNQLQALKQEVMELRGLVEDQSYQLRQLKQQSLERYVDLDRRIGGNAAAVEPENAAAPEPAQPSGGGAAPPAQAGESDAYRSAYALVRSQRFDEAVAAFKQFLLDFPDGKYAPNAHYWMGELYLVITPQDLEASRRSFTLLLEQYPDNAKIPDALYKLGRVYYQKGNPQKSREYLERVINDYGNSNSSAVTLARDFLSENF